MSLNLFYPMDIFYREAGTPLPPISAISGVDMPEPYRQLLVGHHDMTPTLEAYHDDAIDLKIVERHLDGDALSRLVILALRDSGRPVEFGAIVINLQYFPEAARDDIVHSRFPLGSVLARHSIHHDSCPQAFIRIRSDARMNEALQLPSSCVLYGRRNYLLTPKREILADILEILPP